MRHWRAAGIVLAICAFTPAAWAQDFQVGARAKGMGGSYTAFEDDPVSIWLNPAGIATQASQMGIAYQTYTQYEANFGPPASPGSGVGDPEIGVIDPQILPSFQGFVFQIGSAETPMAIGIAYIRPMHLKMTYDVQQPPNGFVDQIDEQQFSRIRLAFAYDLRLRSAENPAGFLTHIAIGGGVDMGFTKWDEKADIPDFTGGGGATVRNDDSATQVGFGAGVLVGLYDNTENFKLVWGLAFQSKLEFDVQVDKNFFPVWDWPAMVNMGLTLYLLEGMPLRVTVDVQLIDWEEATEPADPLSSTEDFRSVRNVSVGAEWRLKVREDGGVLLLPRIGVRLIEAPWADPDNLPAYATQRLLIDTKDSEFTVITAGLGVSWQNTEGKSRGFDLGLEFGADSPNIAFGYTHEF